MDDLFSFTRGLIDLDSTTGAEAVAAEYVAKALRGWGGFEVEIWPLAPGRANVFAHRGRPAIVLSTHLDTVPPFFPSREDETFLHGRGACDAKGILAAQVFAARALAAEGVDDFGLLFVAGEEKNSLGAIAANQRPVGCRFLVNGEPTDSRMASAGKGVLRLDLSAAGRCAHSAYPHLGESAIEKLLRAIRRLEDLELPSDPELGSTTWNIGTLAGGRAPNVVADAARAEILYRLVEPAAPLRHAIAAAAAGLAQADFVLEIPPIRLLTLPGFDTATVAFGTDIPSLTHWGEPLLYGPGSIHLAHTAEERIAKSELLGAVEGYKTIVKELRRRLPPA